MGALRVRRMHKLIAHIVGVAAHDRLAVQWRHTECRLLLPWIVTGETALEQEAVFVGRQTAVDALGFQASGVRIDVVLDETEALAAGRSEALFGEHIVDAQLRAVLIVAGQLWTLPADWRKLALASRQLGADLRTRRFHGA